MAICEHCGTDESVYAEYDGARAVWEEGVRNSVKPAPAVRDRLGLAQQKKIDRDSCRFADQHGVAEKADASKVAMVLDASTPAHTEAEIRSRKPRLKK